MTQDQHLPLPIQENWAWQHSAACRGMDSNVFFHATNEAKATRKARNSVAKTICNGCPVIEQCLRHALTTKEPYGIWGGQSEDERAKMLGLRTLRYPARL